jgi:hypothetical protein
MTLRSAFKNLIAMESRKAGNLYKYIWKFQYNIHGNLNKIHMNNPEENLIKIAIRNSS